jgi:hypothetical protein
MIDELIAGLRIAETMEVKLLEPVHLFQLGGVAFPALVPIEAAVIESRPVLGPGD